MNGAMQSQAEAGLDGGADFNKDVQTTIGSQSDENSALENQQMKSTLPAVVAKLVEHLDANSQMELVDSDMFRQFHIEYQHQLQEIDLALLNHKIDWNGQKLAEELMQIVLLVYVLVGFR